MKALGNLQKHFTVAGIRLTMIKKIIKNSQFVASVIFPDACPDMCVYTLCYAIFYTIHYTQIRHNTKTKLIILLL